MLIKIALCAKWAEFRLDRLDHAQAVTLRRDGATLVVSPVARGPSGAGELALNTYRPLAAREDRMGFMRDEFHIINKEGTTVTPTGGGGSGTGWARGKRTLRIPKNKLEPSTTSFVARVPVAVDVRDIELVLEDVPIIDEKQHP